MKTSSRGRNDGRESEMKEIKIGDTIYVSKFGHTQIKIDCPVCFGKKVVVLILGNEDSVEMRCEYCRGDCCSPSNGYVKEWRMSADVETVIVSQIRTRQTASENEIEYQADSRIYYTKDVFATEEEALTESARRATQYNIDQETKAEHVKGKPDKNYSWNAGYHIREAKKAKEKVEYHSKMAKICKAKAGDGDDTQARTTT